jgi:hypothetical protein
LSAIQGTPTTYDLTVGVKVNMDDVIYTLDPIDTPFLGGVGADGLSVISSFPVDEKEFFWMHENLLIPRGAHTKAFTTAETVLTVTTNERGKYSTGDVLVFVKDTGGVAREQVRVASYGTTTDTLIVTRGWAGTTAASWVTSDSMISLGPVLAEGSDPNNARSKDRASFSNYTQIFGPTKVSMSGTEQVVAKYGVSNEFARQILNRSNEHAIQREQAYLYGVKYETSSLLIRTMGGLDGFITTNVDSTNTQLTTLVIQTNLQTCYDAGGIPDRIVVNPRSLIVMDDTANTSVVRQTIDDPKRGRVAVDEVWTEFGPISLVRHRWCHKTMAFAIKRDGVVRRVLRPFQMERLAKTGDSDHVQILCEEGLEVKGQSHMVKWTALTN